MKRTALVLLGLTVVGTVAARQQEKTPVPICIAGTSDPNYKCPEYKPTENSSGWQIYYYPQDLNAAKPLVIFDEKPVKRMRPPSHPCNINPGGTGDGWIYAVCITGDETYETCADSSRVLLTSEDGKGHCYKFSQ